ncbi:hypothetical protein [Tenacibaculum maritimum]|uniref:hypothetical protein n=1 Tax=Tenacibaculum maritimum TaxID=107401 RepID=UPI00388D6479
MYFFLREPGKDKETSVNLIYFLKKDLNKNKNFKFSTGVKIHPNNWDFQNRMPKTKRGAEGKKNKHLSDILNKFKNVLDEEIRASERDNFDLTKAYLKKIFYEKFNRFSTSSKDIEKQTTNILSAGIDLFIQIKKRSKGVSNGWVIKYNNLKNKIILFDTYRGKVTFFNDINTNWIDLYCGFLRELPDLLKDKKYLAKIENIGIKTKLPKVGYNDNTLNRHITYLFTFLNWSEGQYHKLDLDKLKNPVAHFDTDDIHLTDSEIAALEKIKLPRISLERARDLFLIGVYSGQRFSDYSVFEKADVEGDMIIKRAEKTKKDNFIPLHPKLLRLLEKYNWELPSISTQKFNPHIRKVCRLAGITEKVKKVDISGSKKKVIYHDKCDIVGSHTARRTFITLSAERGMPDHIIMKITGISDPKTLKKYKKTSQKSVSHFANKIWGDS